MGMEAVIAITSRIIDPELVAEAFSALGRIIIDREPIGGGVSVCALFEGNQIEIHISNSIADEFEPEELQMCLDVLIDPHFAAITVSRFQDFNTAIELIPVGDDTLIDNNYDFIKPLPEVRKMARDGVIWTELFGNPPYR